MPDNLGGNEHCTVSWKSNHLWDDTPCDWTIFGHVCEDGFALNPFETDSDGDGLDDGLEVNTYGTEPNVPDTDGDGLTDFDEVNYPPPPPPNSPAWPTTIAPPCPTARPWPMADTTTCFATTSCPGSTPGTSAKAMAETWWPLMGEVSASIYN